MPDPRPSPAAGDVIRSNLINDPDMVELVELFVEEMPARIGGLLETFERAEYTDLKRMAHQLKGACGGYGFPDVGAAAARIEATLMNIAPGSQEISLTLLRSQVDELVDLCRRVSAR